MNLIRIRLRYADLDTFVDRFAPNVTRGGVFLASRNVQPVGAVVPFEIQLVGGEVVLAGQGRVTWVKEFNPAEPQRPFGMGVQFLSIEAGSKATLARILRAKESGVQTRRNTTLPLPPLGTGAYVPLGVTNGKAAGRAAPAIDTSVDLVAEYGLDDQMVRRIIERTWMSGTRVSDDLGDLLKAEPVEPATLQQALAELPRLLEPQFSRRRTSSGFRPLESRAGSIAVPQAESPSAVPETTSVEAGEIAGAGGTPEPTVVLSDGVSAAETVPADGARREEEDGSVDVQTADLNETTDMTGDRDTIQSMQSVPAEVAAHAASDVPFNSHNGRH